GPGTDPRGERMAKDLTSRKDDYNRWYTDVITQSQMADYSPVKGCMVIRPLGYAVWEAMQRELDARFKESGHENAYFPLFTTESLWQEGHTAHATEAEAEEEALKILEIYRRFAEEQMAIPVYTGVKSDSEKFAGALRTYCLEALMQDRKALQAGTSHNLGQNFAKAFEVKYQTKEGTWEHVWSTSWGVSTRLIGALVMAHGDDSGVCFPPRLAPVQVVIVPIWKSDEERTRISEAVRLAAEELKGAFRVKTDLRDEVSPGWKFNEWELKGVPL